MTTEAITVGTGPIQVLGVHGWFGTAESWRTMFPFLDGKNFTYTFLDARGYGKRRDVTGAFDIDEYAGDAIRFCRERGWSEFNVVGHSMGGKVAQRMAATPGSGVRKIIAVTPVPASGVPFDSGTRQFFESAADSIQVRAEIVHGSSGGQLSRTWSGNMAQASISDINTQAFRNFFRSWASADFSSAVQGCAIPVKVIVGRNDPAITRELMEATILSWFPNHQLTVLDNCGHYPMDELPVRFVTEIENFLAG